MSAVIRDVCNSGAELRGRNIRDVAVDPAHIRKSMALPGMSVAWQPQGMSINDALEDIDSLLDQALAVFMDANDLPLPQWGAFQQLTMASGLIRAVHETLIKLEIVSE